jgi:hypothetical protein
MLLHPATARGICKKPKRKGGLRFETKRRSLCMRDKCQSQTPEREIEHFAYVGEQEGATLRLRLYVHTNFRKRRFSLKATTNQRLPV